MSRTLVVGAGVAGLAAAQEIAEAGREVTVLEKERQLGGLAATIERPNGYRFDWGPHRFHQTQSEPWVTERVHGLFRDGELVTSDRASRIHFRGKYLDYPPALGTVWKFGLGTAAKCGVDYLRALPGGKKDGNFEEWVVSRFGRGLYEIYFKEYTEKFWGIPAADITADWAAERVRDAPSLWGFAKEVLLSPFKPKKGGSGEFWYPRHGTQGIPKALARAATARGAEVRTGVGVKRFETDGSRIVAAELDDGTRREDFESVLWTIPATLAPRMIDRSAPREVHDALASLKYRHMVFAFLEIDMPRVSPDHWTYFPHPDVPFARTSEPKNFSAEMVPDASKTSLIVEFPCFADDAVWTMKDEDVVALASRELARVGFVPEGKVTGGFVGRKFNCYPVYYRGFEQHLATLFAWLGEIENLHMTGRAGAYKYTNMDESIQMGYHAARRILAETPASPLEVAPGVALPEAAEPRRAAVVRGGHAKVWTGNQ